jgi:hypothetical protein
MPDLARDLCSHLHLGLHLGPAQVHVAKSKTDIFASFRILIQLERRRLCLIEDFERTSQDLDLTRRHVGVDGTFRPRPHASLGQKNKLIAHAIRGTKALFGIRVIYDLHDTRAIAYIEKDDPAMVASSVNPTTDLDFFTYVSGIQLTAVVATHGNPFFQMARF